MLNSLYLIGSNLNYKQKNIEVVSNNLANINATGYKREVPFSELMDRMNGEQVEHLTDYNDGVLSQTSNPLDLAVTGDAFFTIKTKNGTELTRRGKFKVSDEGFIEDENGDKVLGKKGEINILSFTDEKDPAITITKGGQISVGDTYVDDLLMSKMTDQNLVDRQQGLNFGVGNSNFVAADDGNYQINQGYVEESNVNPVSEMQAMIEISKQFETSQKIENYLDESLGKANEIGRAS
jgi:flagellar basal-body rod protein FlgG